MRFGRATAHGRRDGACSTPTRRTRSEERESEATRCGILTLRGWGAGARVEAPAGGLRGAAKSQPAPRARRRRFAGPNLRLLRGRRRAALRAGAAPTRVLRRAPTKRQRVAAHAHVTSRSSRCRRLRARRRACGAVQLQLCLPLRPAAPRRLRALPSLSPAIPPQDSAPLVCPASSLFAPRLYRAHACIRRRAGTADVPPVRAAAMQISHFCDERAHRASSPRRRPRSVAASQRYCTLRWRALYLLRCGPRLARRWTLGSATLLADHAAARDSGTPTEMRVAPQHLGRACAGRALLAH
jgi:hypothetical protein